MHQRCYNKNNPKYYRYGGKGVKVCERWFDFWSFVEDMGERPAGMSIDRNDNDGDYTPNNCKWSDDLSQRLNQGMRSDNTSGYLCVSSDPYRREPAQYKVSMRINGTMLQFGWYTDPINAAYIADQIRLELIGENTPMNFLGDKAYHPEYRDY